MALALLLSSCTDHPLNNDRNCNEIVMTAGVEDNFAPGNTEIAEPAPELLERMLNYHNPYLKHRFDQTSQNRPVGHSFILPDVSVDNKADVRSAVLTLHLKTIGSSLVYNDRVVLFYTDDEGNLQLFFASDIAWFNNGRWSNNDELTLRLDLGNLPEGSLAGTYLSDVRHLLSNGKIHVYVQDDTAVDFIRLETDYCTDGCSDDEDDELR